MRECLNMIEYFVSDLDLKFYLLNYYGMESVTRLIDGT